MKMSEFRSSVLGVHEFKDRGHDGRVLILSVNSALMCKTIVNKSRKRRGIPVSDLFDSTITGLIYVNENLTREMYQLYTEAKKIDRSKGWKNGFTNYGVICAKKQYGEKYIIISTVQDLCLIN